MILTSRQAPPSMSMRRAPAPEGPLLSPSWSSSFSKKYGVQQMLESPMPSPALPSIIPRHGKKHRPNYLRRVLRWLLTSSKWLCGLLVVYCLLRASFHSNNIRLITDNITLNGKYRLISDDIFLQGPTAVLITNPKGGSKFSLSLPRHLTYPLKPSEYANICFQSNDLARRLRYQSSRSGSSHSQGSRGYYQTDPNFMDVEEAEDYEVLPIKSNHDTYSNRHLSQLPASDHRKEESKNERTGSYGKVCEKTLTYVLETTDAGIGKTLMRLWLSYGLAKKEGRAFFIDDGHWYARLLLHITYIQLTSTKVLWQVYRPLHVSTIAVLPSSATASPLALSPRYVRTILTDQVL